MENKNGSVDTSNVDIEIDMSSEEYGQLGHTYVGIISGEQKTLENKIRELEAYRRKLQKYKFGTKTTRKKIKTTKGDIKKARKSIKENAKKITKIGKRITSIDNISVVEQNNNIGQKPYRAKQR